MDYKEFSLLVGIFSILSTFQFLILDLNELTYIGFEESYSVYIMNTSSVVASWVVANKKYISLSLSTITIVVSALFLYCIHLNVYMGLVGYVGWIVTYEFISFSMVLLTNGIIREQFKELGQLHLIFQISRMLLCFVCLPFVVRHTYSLYRDPKSFSKISRHRMSSISTLDSWTPVGPGMVYRKLN